MRIYRSGATPQEVVAGEEVLIEHQGKYYIAEHVITEHAQNHIKELSGDLSLLNGLSIPSFSAKFRLIQELVPKL